MSHSRQISLSIALSLLMVITACSKAGTDDGPAVASPSSENITPSSTTNTGLQPEKGASLIVWESDGNEKLYLQEVGKQFKQLYGINVEVVPVPSMDTVGKLMTDGPAGIGADVVDASNDAVGRAVTAGLFLKNDLPKQTFAEAYLESIQAAVSYEGIPYGYPLSADTYALYYNKKLLPEAPASFDELFEFSAGFTNAKQKKYAFAWDAGQVYQAYAFLGGYGGYLFGKQGTDSTDIGLNNSGAVEGAVFIQRLKSMFPLNTADINNNVISGLFQEGKAATIIEGTWQMANLGKVSVDYAVAPLPVLPNGKHPRSLLSVRSLFVNAYTRYPNAAKLFAELASDKENAELRFKMTGQLPARKDLTDSPALGKDSNIAAFLTQMTYAEPLPSIPEISTLWVPSYAALSSIWNEGKTDPKKALDNMVEQMKTAMNTNA